MGYSLPGSSFHRIFQARILECHFLLQVIFPTQGLNPGIPHCRQMLLPSEPPGKSPKVNPKLNSVLKKLNCKAGFCTRLQFIKIGWNICKDSKEFIFSMNHDKLEFLKKFAVYVGGLDMFMEREQ